MLGLGCTARSPKMRRRRRRPATLIRDAQFEDSLVPRCTALDIPFSLPWSNWTPKRFPSLDSHRLLYILHQPRSMAFTSSVVEMVSHGSRRDPARRRSWTSVGEHYTASIKRGGTRRPRRLDFTFIGSLSSLITLMAIWWYCIGGTMR